MIANWDAADFCHNKAICTAGEIGTTGDIFSSHRRLRKQGDWNGKIRLSPFLVKQSCIISVVSRTSWQEQMRILN